MDVERDQDTTEQAPADDVDAGATSGDTDATSGDTDATSGDTDATSEQSAVIDEDAGTVAHSVWVAAPIEDTFDQLTSSDAIELWWGHPNEFADGVEPGSIGVFHWQDITFPVRIDTVDAPTRFGLTWGSGRQLDDEATQVEFTLVAEGDGTRLSVLESGFDRLPDDKRAAQMADNASGWTQVLASFARHMVEYEESAMDDEV